MRSVCTLVVLEPAIERHSCQKYTLYTQLLPELKQLGLKAQASRLESLIDRRIVLLRIMGSLVLPHVVVVPIEPSGHYIPFLLFAKRLVAQGLTVTVVSSDHRHAEIRRKHRDELEESVIRFVGLGDGSDRMTLWERFQELETLAGREKSSRLLVDVITDLSSPRAQQLRGVPTAPSPVCVLFDMLAGWAVDAAEKLRIPKHLLYVSPVTCLCVGLQSERLGREGRVPVTPENQDIVITDIPGLPPLRPTDLQTMYLSEVSYDWFHYHENRNRRADVILVNSFYELEKQAIDAVRQEVIGTPGVQTKCLLDIGPLHPEPSTAALDLAAVEETDPCIVWLNTQKPASVLYVCFGSHTTLPASQLLELAKGLEASGQAFLWVLRRPKSLPILDPSEPSTSMTEYLPPGFEERMKGRGMCYGGWACQKRILAHPATGGFVTHCGWNSILESIAAGVPMLTWAFWADQNLNNRFLVDTARLAMELDREPVDPEQDLDGKPGMYTRRVRKEEIANKVRKLMQQEGEVIRQNVKEMQVKMRSAVAPGGLSSRNFDKYVAMLRAMNSAGSSSSQDAKLTSITQPKLAQQTLIEAA